MQPQRAPSSHRRAQRSVCPTATGGDDDRRRTFSLPREGLQPCVAPYFATRGRGDMRGGRGGVPPKSHPGGGAGLSHPPWCVSCCVSMLCDAMTACHHLRGGIMGAFPACRRHPGRRNTGLRTASTPAGVGEMSASGHRAMLRIAGGRFAAPDWRLQPPLRCVVIYCNLGRNCTFVQ